MKKILSWIFGVAGAVVAGLIVFWLTQSAPTQHRPPEPTVEEQDPCDPLPEYLSELKIMPPSFPGATVPIRIEFEAMGPDPAGRIREYQWSYDGETKLGKRVEFVLTRRGANIVNLSVTDSSGCTVHRERRIVAR